MRFIGRINIALFMFLLVIIAGTLGFRVLEPQVNSFLDSFFFTLTTVTTVGYGNIVPLTVAGKILAIGIIFVGVGSAMVALQGTFEVLVGKRIKEVFNLPDKRIEKQNHHIICGYGMVGKAIVRHLETLGLEFVVIEQEGGKVNRLVEAKVPVILGLWGSDQANLQFFLKIHSKNSYFQGLNYPFYPQKQSDSGGRTKLIFSFF